MALMEVTDLTMRFGGIVAVDTLTFNIDKGSITALIGPNGAGKTSAFNCLTGFYKATAPPRCCSSRKAARSSLKANLC